MIKKGIKRLYYRTWPPVKFCKCILDFVPICGAETNSECIKGKNGKRNKTSELMGFMVRIGLRVRFKQVCRIYYFRVCLIKQH